MAVGPRMIESNMIKNSCEECSHDSKHDLSGNEHEVGQGLVEESSLSQDRLMLSTKGEKGEPLRSLSEFKLTLFTLCRQCYSASISAISSSDSITANGAVIIHGEQAPNCYARSTDT